MKTVAFFSRLVFITFLVSHVSCSRDEGPVEIYLDHLSISSSRGKNLFLSGGTTELSVTGFDQFGDRYAIDSVVQWSVNNDNVSIDQNGHVAAQALGSSTVTASVGEVAQSYVIAVIPDPTYEVYVSDAGNFDEPPWQILKYYDDGVNPEVFINSHLAWPQDILILEDQQVVLVSNLTTGNIAKHDLATGKYLGDFATGIDEPTRMKIGPDSLLYVLQWQGNGRVLRYYPDGRFVDEFTTVGVPQSIGIDWDESGNLYVSSYSDGLVRAFDDSGKDLGIFIDSHLVGPTNLWFEENGNLLVLDWDGGAVRRFSDKGMYIEDFATGLSQSEGIDRLTNGNYLIGNGGDGSVKMFDETGDFLKDFVRPGSGGLMTPNAVVIRYLAPGS